MLLTESLKHSSDKSDSTEPDFTQLKPPTKSSFDFKLVPDIPSDCGSIAKDYDTHQSPHSTPSKRSSPQGKSVGAKRKRTSKTTSAVTPKADNEAASKTKSGVARKKLEMPSAAPSTSVPADSSHKKSPTSSPRKVTIKVDIV